MSAPVASKSTYETEPPSPFGWARSLVLLCPLHRQRNRYACRAARCWRNAANWINPTLASSSLNPKLRRSSTYSSTLLRHEVTAYLLARAKPMSPARPCPPSRRWLWSAMPEKLADLRQRRSLSKHLTGECVPELVGSCARSLNPCPSQGVSHQGADPRLTFETSRGRFRPQKHTSTAGGWPPMPQVISDGRPDIGRQWQLRIASRLPTHRNQSLLPIQIFQRERPDFTRAQTQARQGQENCIVAAAHSRLPVDRSQHQFYLVRRKGARYGR